MPLNTKLKAIILSVEIKYFMRDVVCDANCCA